MRDRIEDRALLAAVAIVVATLLMVLFGACSHCPPKMAPEPGRVTAPLTCMTAQQTTGAEVLLCTSRAAVCAGAHALANEWKSRMEIAILRPCMDADVSVTFAPDAISGASP